MPCYTLLSRQHSSSFKANTSASLCPQMALYFCTGDLPEPEWRHWALGMPRYTHFTSPIRSGVLAEQPTCAEVCGETFFWRLRIHAVESLDHALRSWMVSLLATCPKCLTAFLRQALSGRHCAPAAPGGGHAEGA